MDNQSPTQNTQSGLSPRFKGEELASPLRRRERLKKWIPFAIGAALNFFAANAITSTITAEVDGLACIFYLSTGAIFCGACHMIIMSFKSGKWHSQNLVFKREHE